MIIIIIISSSSSSSIINIIVIIIIIIIILISLIKAPFGADKRGEVEYSGKELGALLVMLAKVGT